MKANVKAVLAALTLLCACASRPLAWRPLEELTGDQLYQRLCSSCHGVQARGDGSVAAVIAVRVPDLTRLAQREGGEFPTEDVRRIIDGRFERSAHGTREMPVWGWQLLNGAPRSDSRERARVDALIDRLVEYLRSVQTD
jgi:mono/diheme cytochrome c family protein